MSLPARRLDFGGAKISRAGVPGGQISRTGAWGGRDRPCECGAATRQEISRVEGGAGLPATARSGWRQHAVAVERPSSRQGWTPTAQSGSRQHAAAAVRPARPGRTAVERSTPRRRPAEPAGSAELAGEPAAVGAAGDQAERGRLGVPAAEARGRLAGTGTARPEIERAEREPAGNGTAGPAGLVPPPANRSPRRSPGPARWSRRRGAAAVSSPARDPGRAPRPRCGEQQPNCRSAAAARGVRPGG